MAGAHASCSPTRAGSLRRRVGAAVVLVSGLLLSGLGFILLGLPSTGRAADPALPAAPPQAASAASAPRPVLPNANHIPAPGLLPQPLTNPPRWTPLVADGLHDPRGPGIGVLQQPGDALSALPPDSTGNQVRWVQALETGAIAPRASILPGTEIRLRDQDLIVAKNGSMPAVKFPHRQHTLWLDCSNCHPYPFKDKLGANRLSMMAILNGEQCGLCHGAVSFPLTECNRCHSVPNATLKALQAAAPPPAGPGASASASTNASTPP